MFKKIITVTVLFIWGAIFTMGFTSLIYANSLGGGYNTYDSYGGKTGSIGSNGLGW